MHREQDRHMTLQPGGLHRHYRGMEQHSDCPADLVFYADSADGWTRRRRGTGFSYHEIGGKPVSPLERQRIAGLAIPPAWSKVWICPDPTGHLQATGRDQRGRKQYLYHTRWSEHRSEDKFGTLVAFAEALPNLRASVEADLRRRSISLPFVAASVVWLLDNSLIRVGNSTYARDNKSFGLTTLRNRHVSIAGANVRFRFKGKSGKQWDLQLTDRRIARIVGNLQHLPGQYLFQYQDETGLHPITSREVNGYIFEHTQADFSSKDFRTWAATVGMHTRLIDEPLPDSERAQTKIINAALDAVAARLGNTRAVCRSSYVHPAIIDDWANGALQRVKRLKSVPLFEPEEQETLAYLRSRGAAAKRA